MNSNKNCYIVINYNIKEGDIISMKAGFTKEFAIGAMIKDVTIKAAIFDLIDNSIEAAIINGGVRGHIISIMTTNDEFKIFDDCGGFDPDKIKDIFKIGYRKGSAGFGIGMKRVIIKLGNKAEIISFNFNKSFNIYFDINNCKNAEWDLKVNEIKREPENPFGLNISITKLNSEVKKYFKRGECNELGQAISRRYRSFINNGLIIKLNGDIIPKYKIKEEADKISPIYKINRNVEVQIKLYSKISTTEESGWDVFINNKCVCERERSNEIQWSRIKKQSGYSYKRFVGEVFITGINVRELPVVSTKDRIDFDSDIMREAIRYMYSFLSMNKDLYKKNDITIQFDKDIDEVELLKEYFDVSTATDTGKRSFEKIYGEAKKRKDTNEN